MEHHGKPSKSTKSFNFNSDLVADEKQLPMVIQQNYVDARNLNKMEDNSTTTTNIIACENNANTNYDHGNINNDDWDNRTFETGTATGTINTKDGSNLLVQSVLRYSHTNLLDVNHDDQSTITETGAVAGTINTKEDPSLLVQNTLRYSRIDLLEIRKSKSARILPECVIGKAQSLRIWNPHGGFVECTSGGGDSGSAVSGVGITRTAEASVVGGGGGADMVEKELIAWKDNNSDSSCKNNCCRMGGSSTTGGNGGCSGGGICNSTCANTLTTIGGGCNTDMIWGFSKISGISVGSTSVCVGGGGSSNDSGMMIGGGAIGGGGINSSIDINHTNSNDMNGASNSNNNSSCSQRSMRWYQPDSTTLNNKKPIRSRERITNCKWGVCNYNASTTSTITTTMAAPSLSIVSSSSSHMTGFNFNSDLMADEKQLPMVMQQDYVAARNPSKMDDNSNTTTNIIAYENNASTNYDHGNINNDDWDNRTFETGTATGTINTKDGSNLLVQSVIRYSHTNLLDVNHDDQSAITETGAVAGTINTKEDPNLLVQNTLRYSRIDLLEIRKSKSARILPECAIGKAQNLRIWKPHGGFVERTGGGGGSSSTVSGVGITRTAEASVVGGGGGADMVEKELIAWKDNNSDSSCKNNCCRMGGSSTTGGNGGCSGGGICNSTCANKLTTIGGGCNTGMIGGFGNISGISVGSTSVCVGGGGSSNDSGMMIGGGASGGGGINSSIDINHTNSNDMNGASNSNNNSTSSQRSMRWYQPDSTTLNNKKPIRSRERIINCKWRVCNYNASTTSTITTTMAASSLSIVSSNSSNSHMISGGGGGITSQINLSSAKSSYMDNRSMSSSHLMPAFAKKHIDSGNAFATTATSSYHQTIGSSTNDSNSAIGGGGGGSSGNNSSGVGGAVGSCLTGNDDSTKGFKFESLSTGKHSGDKSGDDKFSSLRNHTEKDGGTISGGVSNGANKRMERRIGSGRLISDISNRDFGRNPVNIDDKEVDRDRDMDTKHLNHNEAIDDNDSLLFRGDSRIGRASSGIIGIGDRRLFDQQRSLDGNNSVGGNIGRDKYNKDSINSGSNSSRTMNMRRYNNNNNSNSQLSQSSYGDNPFFQQRTLTFKRNQRASDRSKDKLIKSRDMEKEEPEWFSGGPISQHDTIELRGFDEFDENGDDTLSGDENRSTKTNILNIKKAKQQQSSSSETTIGVMFDKYSGIDNDAHPSKSSDINKTIPNIHQMKSDLKENSSKLEMNENSAGVVSGVANDDNSDHHNNNNNKSVDNAKNNWELTDDPKHAIDNIQEPTAKMNCLHFTDLELLQEDQGDQPSDIALTKYGHELNEKRIDDEHLPIGINQQNAANNNDKSLLQAMKEPNVVNEILKFLDMDTLEYPLIGCDSSREPNEGGTSRFSRWFNQKDVGAMDAAVGQEATFNTAPNERRDIDNTGGKQSNTTNNIDLENREKSSDNTRSNSLLSFLRNNNLTAGQGQGALPHSAVCVEELEKQMRLLDCNSASLRIMDAQNTEKNKTTAVSDNNATGGSNLVELQPKKDVDAFKRLLHQLGSTSGNNADQEARAKMEMFMIGSPIFESNLPRPQLFNTPVDHHPMNMMVHPTGTHPGVLAQNLPSANSVHYNNLQNHHRQSQQQFQQSIAAPPIPQVGQAGPIGRPPPRAPGPVPSSHHIVGDDKIVSHFEQINLPPPSLIVASQSGNINSGDITSIPNENNRSALATTAAPFMIQQHIAANAGNNIQQQTMQFRGNGLSETAFTGNHVGDMNRLGPSTIHNNVNENDPSFYRGNIGCHPLVSNMPMPPSIPPTSTTLHSTIPNLTGTSSMPLLKDSMSNAPGDDNVSSNLSSNINDAVVATSKKPMMDVANINDGLAPFAINTEGLAPPHAKKNMLKNPQATDSGPNTANIPYLPMHPMASVTDAQVMKGKLDEKEQAQSQLVAPIRRRFDVGPIGKPSKQLENTEPAQQHQSQHQQPQNQQHTKNAATGGENIRSPSISHHHANNFNVINGTHTIQQPPQLQQTKFRASPSPLAFTPTSVLRKMTADKETIIQVNENIQNSPHHHQQQPQQQQQQQQQQQPQPQQHHHQQQQPDHHNQQSQQTPWLQQQHFLRLTNNGVPPNLQGMQQQMHGQHIHHLQQAHLPLPRMLHGGGTGGLNSGAMPPLTSQHQIQQIQQQQQRRPHPQQMPPLAPLSPQKPPNQAALKWHATTMPTNPGGRPIFSGLSAAANMHMTQPPQLNHIPQHFAQQIQSEQNTSQHQQQPQAQPQCQSQQQQQQQQQQVLTHPHSNKMDMQSMQHQPVKNFNINQQAMQQQHQNSMNSQFSAVVMAPPPPQQQTTGSGPGFPMPIVMNAANNNDMLFHPHNHHQRMQQQQQHVQPHPLPIGTMQQPETLQKHQFMQQHNLNMGNVQGGVGNNGNLLTSGNVGNVRNNSGAVSSVAVTGGGPSNYQQQQQVHQQNQPSQQQQQRDRCLSPTSNQLAQWFSPELLAQASAGKLPLLNASQTVSLEEFERNIQHSTAIAHN